MFYLFSFTAEILVFIVRMVVDWTSCTQLDSSHQLHAASEGSHGESVVSAIHNTPAGGLQSTQFFVREGGRERERERGRDRERQG